MVPASGIPDPARIDAIKAEVAAVLASQVFSRCPSLAQFLSYVCEKSLAGEANQIKEYNIATEALGRHPEFDQKEDAIVRVEAHRLRKRLKDYYETEGTDHGIRIVVPPGQYAPQFVEIGQPAVLAPLPVVPAGGNGHIVPAGLLPAPRHRPRRWVVPAALGGIAVASLLFFLLAAGRRQRETPATATAAAPLPAVVGEEGIRIACGSSEPKRTDSAGNVWLSDRFYTGGGAAAMPNQPVGRTRDAFVYQRRREGDFRYDIPLRPGTYELQLHFAEPVYGAGNLAGGGETSRLFHVSVNGRPLLTGFDIVSDAGGANLADVKVFRDVSPAPDGYLHLQFAQQKDNPFVNGIVVLPGVPGRMRPVRIAAGEENVRDHAGNLWPSDRFFAGGQTVLRPQTTAGTEDPELFNRERFGNFSYAVPVAEGRYTVNLKFSEAWFGPGKPAGGGEGSRLFDVQCNGATLLKNFDLFRTAGGSNRAVEKSFRGLAPNAQGKLILSFVPVRNYALVNAIEVVAEGR